MKSKWRTVDPTLSTNWFQFRVVVPATVAQTEHQAVKKKFIGHDLLFLILLKFKVVLSRFYVQYHYLSQGRLQLIL